MPFEFSTFILMNVLAVVFEDWLRRNLYRTWEVAVKIYERL